MWQEVGTPLTRTTASEVARAAVGADGEAVGVGDDCLRVYGRGQGADVDGAEGAHVVVGSGLRLLGVEEAARVHLAVVLGAGLGVDGLGRRSFRARRSARAASSASSTQSGSVISSGSTLVMAGPSRVQETLKPPRRPCSPGDSSRLASVRANRRPGPARGRSRGKRTSPTQSSVWPSAVLAMPVGGSVSEVEARLGPGFLPRLGRLGVRGAGRRPVLVWPFGVRGGRR